MLAKSIAVFLVVAALAGCGSDAHEDQATEAMTGPAMLIDFSTLERPSSPNTYLVAPETGVAGYVGVPGDEAAPVVGVAAPALVDAWRGVVQSQPRTQVTFVSEDSLQIEAAQKSAVFGFVDRISFRALPLTDEQSTFIAYSRSESGYWDLGVNRSRLRQWTDAVREAAVNRR